MSKLKQLLLRLVRALTTPLFYVGYLFVDETSPATGPWQAVTDYRATEVLMRRWKDQPSQFRQFVSFRYDIVKLLAAFSGGGLASAALFITQASRPVWAITI